MLNKFIYEKISLSSISTLFHQFLLFSYSTSSGFSGESLLLFQVQNEFGKLGCSDSEAQKKQIKNRLKNRLEKTYILDFNTEESLFIEEEKVDAISGATDTWGTNFARGKQYKNVAENQLVQAQEFYGKRFLVVDELQPIKWKMGSEVKQIGGYTCFKATAILPEQELSWYNFSWNQLSSNASSTTEQDIQLTQIEAWYTLQIPVKQGPAEFWGLPGLILEVSAGDTTILCSEIVLNPKDRDRIDAPEKGQIITKTDYRATIIEKMTEMRNSYGRRSRS